MLPLLISGLSRAPRLRQLQLDFQDPAHGAVFPADKVVSLCHLDSGACGCPEASAKAVMWRQDCPEAFGDKELGRLASALPSGLVTLNLCLLLGERATKLTSLRGQSPSLSRWGLGKVSAAGAAALSSRLPGTLRDFTLMLGTRVEKLPQFRCRVLGWALSPWPLQAANGMMLLQPWLPWICDRLC